MKPRFSIRDLLWLTMVVAMAVGWWSGHKRSTAIEAKLRNNEIELYHQLADRNREIQTLKESKTAPSTTQYNDRSD